MIKVLIIGSNGQLGKSFKRFEQRSIASGIKLLFSDRTSLDITKSENIGAFLIKNDIDVVINTAAYTAVDLAEKDNDIAIQVNSTAVKNLAYECEKTACKLIHISTDYVFDGEKSNPYTELDTTNPLSVYGTTKLEGETFALQHCPQAIILRTSWVFSEFGNNFLKSMLRLGQSHRELNIVSDQFGKPTYAPHIADVVLKIIKQEQTQNITGIYHFCGHKEVSWSEFARYIFETDLCIRKTIPSPNVFDIPTSEYPTAAIRPKNSSLDCSKIYKLLDIETYHWEEGVMQSLVALSME
jgi:dTDP-4-dehydrorhamnose reductase